VCMRKRLRTFYFQKISTNLGSPCISRGLIAAGAVKPILPVLEVCDTAYETDWEPCV